LSRSAISLIRPNTSPPIPIERGRDFVEQYYSLSIARVRGRLPSVCCWPPDNSRGSREAFSGKTHAIEVAIARCFGPRSDPSRTVFGNRDILSTVRWKKVQAVGKPFRGEGASDERWLLGLHSAALFLGAAEVFRRDRADLPDRAQNWISTQSVLLPDPLGPNNSGTSPALYFQGRFGRA